MTSTDRIIRWSTALAVASRRSLRWCPTSALVLAHGETGWTAYLIPLTVDGLIYASSMVMLDSARRRMPVPPLARWLLGLGTAATLAANVAHGLGHGPIGAAVGAWPAVALAGSYELLMIIIRRAQVAEDASISPDDMLKADPLQEHAAQLFADDLSADRLPSIRAIRAQLHVGQPRARRVRAYLAVLASKPSEKFAA